MWQFHDIDVLTRDFTQKIGVGSAVVRGVWFQDGSKIV